ncbi:MAG: hypothetical protein AB2A00_30735 [Myxococcota bacterium]
MAPAMDPLAQAFQRFAAALEAQDVAAYHAMSVEDAAPQDELFLRNARRLKDKGLSLRLRRAVQEEDAAEVAFDVVDADGKAVDSGKVTFTRESDGWRIRTL